MESGSTLLPAFWLHFVFVLLRINKKEKPKLLVAYGVSSLLWLLNLADFLFFQGIFAKELTPKLDFNFYPTAGIGYYIFFFYFFTVVFYSLMKLLNALKKLDGVKSSQAKYMFFAGLLGFSGGGMTFLPTVNILVKPVGIILFSLYTLPIAYAILRYRLMDIRAIVARTLGFGFIVLVLTAIFAITSAVITFFFTNLVGITSNIIAGIILSLLVVSGYRPIVKLVENTTNRFLFKKSYIPDELISKISEIGSSTLDIKKLLKSFGDVLNEALRFEKFGVALLDTDGKLNVYYKYGFKPGVAEGLASYPDVASILVKELSQNKGSVLVIDEMQVRHENGEFQPVSPDLLQKLHDNNLAVVIPLYVKKNLTGVIVIGAKKSGDPYSKQDISTLKIIGDQAAVAIDNARLYEELRYFNIKLEEEVKEKTKQLSKANQDLKKLDVAKSEFISIASHQLRTPLTVIKGYISMMREGSFGKIRPKILENLEKVYVSNERLIQLVENLLDISRIESGRQEFAWKKIQLEDLAAEVTEKLQENAQKKNLKLTFHKPQEKLPPVVIDDGKIHEVMMNFVDNAIKYTETGTVDVYIKKDKEMLTFCVKDTGKGMSEEGKQKLFQKFSRGKDSFRQHTEGLGLGLYVATMMMKAHEGKIWAESPGEGKGSTFCFAVPIKSKHKDGEITKIDEKLVEEAKEKEKKETLKKVVKK